ncbi:MAG: ABC transporter substrate-binding protein, partial [Rhodanobacteraceae bacterium]
SVPAAALQYWLRKQIHAGPDAIRAVYQGENQVVQALLTGAVDGAAALDPAIDIVMARRPDARIVVEGSRLFPGQPGAGLLVRESLIKKDPQYVRELVAAHIQATQLLRDHPRQAAVAVQKYLGGGRLSEAIVLQSMKNVVYDADPHRLEQNTKTLYDFQSHIGVLKKPLVVHDLFDTQIYDQLK